MLTFIRKKTTYKMKEEPRPPHCLTSSSMRWQTSPGIRPQTSILANVQSHEPNVARNQTSMLPHVQSYEPDVARNQTSIQPNIQSHEPDVARNLYSAKCPELRVPSRTSRWS